MEPFRLEIQELPECAKGPRLPLPKVTTPVGGLDVPDLPVAPVGAWYSDDTWRNPNYGLLDPSAFRSARNAEVFEWARKGPRGGQFWAVKSEAAWLAWVKVYRARVEARAIGDCKRRLGYDNPKRRKRR